MRRELGFVHSNAQTLGIHSTKRQIVTRGGNAGVLELEFDDNGGIRVLIGRSGTAHHYRIHNEHIQALGEIGPELGEGAR